MWINLTQKAHRQIDKFVCSTCEIGDDMNMRIPTPSPGVYCYKAEDKIPPWAIEGDGLTKFGIDAEVTVHPDGSVTTTFPSAGNAIKFTR